MRKDSGFREVKLWLQRGRYLNREINALLDAKRRAFDLACAFGGGLGEKVQTSPTNSQERRLLSLAEYELEIDRQIDKLYRITEEIRQVIEKVEDSTLRVLLIERYINCKTWEQVAEEVDKEVRWVYELHKKALVAVKKIRSTSL